MTYTIFVPKNTPHSVIRNKYFQWTVTESCPEDATVWQVWDDKIANLTRVYDFNSWVHYRDGNPVAPEFNELGEVAP